MFGNLLSTLGTAGLDILKGGAAIALDEREKSRAYNLEKKRLDIQTFQQQREAEKIAAESATASQLTNIMRFAGFGLIGLVIAWVGVTIAKRVIR